ncbi:hypothetical protein AVEN_262386-1 [Araneus ventricosus]|uniref:Uncharacterized protein n=1 Tax=Araneus ventricosus TaxID=182803 RepID=A0A4Y2IJB2_ARAVE|nr:hypothetical protein AVEN_262386-1 [Araneus ventricosus]
MTLTLATIFATKFLEKILEFPRFMVLSLIGIESWIFPDNFMCRHALLESYKYREAWRRGGITLAFCLQCELLSRVPTACLPTSFVRGSLYCLSSEQKESMWLVGL